MTVPLEVYGSIARWAIAMRMSRFVNLGHLTKAEAVQQASIEYFGRLQAARR